MKKIVFLLLMSALLAMTLSLYSCAAGKLDYEVSPANGSVVSIVNPKVTLKFSEPLDKATVTAKNFSDKVQNAVYDEKSGTVTLYIIPNYLYRGAEVELNFTDAVKAKSGNALENTKYVLKISDNELSTDESLVSNGDMENTDWVPFFVDGGGAISENSIYTIIEDPDNSKNHVLKVSPAEGIVKTYQYTRQFLNLEPGCSYKMELDAKLVTDTNGSTEGSTDICVSTMYKSGKDAFVPFGGTPKLKIGGGWSHVYHVITMPEKIDNPKQVQLSIYANPIGGNYGAVYLLDNIKITRVTSAKFSSDDNDVMGAPPASITITPNVKFKLPENSFEKKGYEFQGWRANGEEKIYAEGEEVAFENNVSFEPVFIKEMPKVKFVSLTDGITVPNEILGAYDGKVSLPECSVGATKLKFVGYTDCANGIVPLSNSYTVTRIQTLYPLFENESGVISTKFDASGSALNKKGEFAISCDGAFEINEDYGSLTLKLENATEADYVWELSSDKIVIEAVGEKSVVLRGLRNGEATVVCKSVENEDTVCSAIVTVTNQKNKTADRGIKVMLFGNSILKHGPLPSNNWFNDWGMAASKQSNDYMHRLCEYYMPNNFGAIQYRQGGQSFEGVMAKLNENTADDFDYITAFKPMAQAIADYGADIAIFQMGDNVNQTAPYITTKQYQKSLEVLVDEVNKLNRNVNIILTSAYYAKPFTTEGTKAAAASRGTLFVAMHDLSIPIYRGGNDGTGSSDEGGFIGGVRSHPGDKGMEKIAIRMLCEIQKIIGKYPIKTVEGAVEGASETETEATPESFTYDKDASFFSFEEEGNTMGFTSYNLFHFKSLSGTLQGTATDVATTGANMKFISPALDIKNRGTLVIRMKHSAFDGKTEIRVVINGKNEFKKSVASSEMTDYIFDISEVGEKITLLEIYPTNIDSGIEISYIGFTDKSGAAAIFENSLKWKDGIFKDIAIDKWYYKDVKAAYAIGLMNGISSDTFSPDGTVSVSQAITVACRINAVLKNAPLNTDGDFEKWYTPYINEAVKRGIVTENEYNDVERPATRAEIVSILYKAVTAETLYEINSVSEIIDVDKDNAHFGAILGFYKAGIIAGSDEKRSFKPDDFVKRSELSAIISRITRTENRIKF